MQILKHHKKSILWSWITSYILILMVPIVIGSWIYLQATRIIESEIQKSGTAMLRQVQLGMDSTIRDIDRIAKEITFDADFDKLAGDPAQVSRLSAYTTVEFQKLLSRYLQFNSSVSYIYVYFSQSRQVAGSTGATDADTFFSSHYPDMKDAPQFWASTLENAKNGEMIMTGSDTKKEVAWVQTVSAPGTGKRRAVIVIALDAQKIQRVLTDVQWASQGSVLILDNQDRVVAATRTVADGTYRFSELPEAAGDAHLENKDGRLVVSTVSSALTPWKYVALTPEKIYEEKTQYIRRVTLISLGICLALGLGLTFWFSRRNYHPLRALFRNTMNRVSRGNHASGNEYEVIRAAFEEMAEVRDQADRKLTGQKALVRAHALERMLRGRSEDLQQLAETLAGQDVELGESRFAVMILDGDVPGTWAAPDQAAWRKDLQLTQFILTNLSEEMLQPHGRAYGVAMDNRVAVLLDAGSGDADILPALRETASAIQRLVTEHFGIHVTIAVSGIHETLMGISQAYDDCLQALEYRMLSGGDAILSYDLLRRPQPSASYYYPLETEQKLINHLRKGELVPVRETLAKVYRRNFEQQQLPVAMVRCLMFNIIGTLHKAGPAREDAPEYVVPDPDLLLHCDTIDEMKQQIDRLMVAACDCAGEKRESDDNQMRAQLDAYILAHYQDADLSVEKMADHFGKSRGYLFAQMKDETGEGLLYQINRVRIARARELLASTELSVGDVAQRVGIPNVNSFIRVFKKYEGLTPGKCREQLKSTQERGLENR